jgi:hypothetical protein
MPCIQMIKHFRYALSVDMGAVVIRGGVFECMVVLLGSQNPLSRYISQGGGKCTLLSTTFTDWAVYFQIVFKIMAVVIA